MDPSFLLKQVQGRVVRDAFEPGEELALGRIVTADLAPADFPATLRKRATRVPRTPIPETPLDARGDFAEVVLPLTRDAARQEAARCLACDTFCSVCTSVCPNHAFLTYTCAPFAADLPSWTVADGAPVPAAPERFAVAQATQTAVLTDFCNECANCATFCPTAGRPYADKPRLYVSLSEFLSQENNAYRITGTGAARSIAARFAGATHTLTPTPTGYRYTTPAFTIDLTPTLAPLSAPTLTAPTDRLTLLPAAAMKVLLENVAPAQVPVVEG